jgi:hypothetical protein
LVGCFLPGAAFSVAFTVLAVALLTKTLWERLALAKGTKAEVEARKKAKRKEKRIFKWILLPDAVAVGLYCEKDGHALKPMIFESSFDGLNFRALDGVYQVL